MAVTEAPWQVRAQAKWVRRSPRKVQLVVKEIRGLTVPEARTVLAFMPQAAAQDVEKVLSSAAANAEANFGLISDELIVHEAYVGQGPTLRRFKARARGRVGRIRKPTCHIVIGLTDPPDLWDESLPLESVTPELPVAEDPVAAPADEVAEDSGEPYEGYEGSTAKDVIAQVKELDDDQLLAVQRVDTRKTVQTAVVSEIEKRGLDPDAASADAASAGADDADAADTDVSDDSAEASDDSDTAEPDEEAEAAEDEADEEPAEPEEDEPTEEAPSADGDDEVDWTSQTAKDVIAQVPDLDDAQLLDIQSTDTRKTVQRAVIAELGRRGIEINDQDGEEE